MLLPSGDVFSIQRNAAHSPSPVGKSGGHLWLRAASSLTPRQQSRPEKAHKPLTFLSAELVPELTADLMRSLRHHFLGGGEGV